MKKWADYLISAVRYNSDPNNRMIAYLKVHVDDGISVGESRTWTKEELIDALIKGKTFVTILRDGSGNWKKGSDVSVTASKEIFIRTDFKSIPGDFLEDLPDF
jgi:uncharacterized protein (DUF2147 family)